MPSIAALLEDSRRELLDLSTRNRLLSMPTESKSARVIHVRDEKSDPVFRLLVAERKAMTFLPGLDKNQRLPPPPVGMKPLQRSASTRRVTRTRGNLPFPSRKTTRSTRPRANRAATSIPSSRPP